MGDISVSQGDPAPCSQRKETGRHRDAAGQHAHVQQGSPPPLPPGTQAAPAKKAAGQAPLQEVGDILLEGALFGGQATRAKRRRPAPVWIQAVNLSGGSAPWAPPPAASWPPLPPFPPPENQPPALRPAGGRLGATPGATQRPCSSRSPPPLARAPPFLASSWLGKRGVGRLVQGVLGHCCGPRPTSPAPPHSCLARWALFLTCPSIAPSWISGSGTTP